MAQEYQTRKKEEDKQRRRLLRKHIYEYDNIVVGNNLNAIIHAYKTNSLVVPNTVVRIFPFDAICDALDLGPIRFDAGTSKVTIWERLSWELAMAGLNPMSKVESLRLEKSESQISVSSKIFRQAIFRFSNLQLFDTENLHGLPFEPLKIVKY